MNKPANPVLNERQGSLLKRRSEPPAAIADQLARPAGTSKEIAQLKALIREHRSPTPVRLRITKLMALAMLSLMGRNRKLSRHWVARWKVVLAEGRWRELHHGIAFDTNGNLRDGQHRLVAIAETDAAVDVWVFFGMDPDDFPAIDTGFRRNAAQNLAYDEVKYAGHVSAVVRLKYRTDHNGATPDDQAVYLLGHQLTDPDDVLHRALIGAGKLYRKKRVTVSSAALAYWLIAKEARRKLNVDEFWEHLIEGHRLERDSPIFKVRDRFDRLARDQSKKAKQYLTQTQQAAWIILAWNAWVSGDTALPQWTDPNSLPAVK